MSFRSASERHWGRGLELTRHYNLKVEVNQLYPVSGCVTTHKAIPIYSLRR